MECPEDAHRLNAGYRRDSVPLLMGLPVRRLRRPALVYPYKQRLMQ